MMILFMSITMIKVSIVTRKTKKCVGYKKLFIYHVYQGSTIVVLYYSQPYVIVRVGEIVVVVSV